MTEWFGWVLAVAGVSIAVLIVAARRRRPTPFVARAGEPPVPIGDARLAEPARIPDDVRTLIGELRDADSRDAAADALVARGPGVVLDLVSALADPEDPAREHVIAVLGRIGDPRARAVLERIVVREQWHWTDALAAAVSFGTQDAIALALSVLDRSPADGGSDPGRPARGAVCEGIVAAGTHGRITPEFRDALLLPVLRRVGEPRAADAVVALDPDAAARLLQSPEVLERGLDAVTSAFSAVTEAELPVDADVIMTYAARLPVRPAAPGPEAESLAVILTALAASRHPRARDRIEAFRDLPDRTTRAAAVYALAVLEGVHGAAAFVLDRAAEVGAAGLTGPQRTYHLAWSYLNARSHAEWLAAHADSDGDSDAGDAEAALRTIGATSAADLLAAARRRYASLAVKRRTTGEGADAYLDLDERLVDESWNVRTLLTEYALAHPDEFRPPQAA